MSDNLIEQARIESVSFNTTDKGRTLFAELADEIARLTAEGKELQADRDTLNEALHRARAAIDSNHEDIVYDIIDLKEELAEARRRLGEYETVLTDAVHHLLDKYHYSSSITFAAKDLLARASLPAKPSGEKP